MNNEVRIIIRKEVNCIPYCEITIEHKHKIEHIMPDYNEVSRIMDLVNHMIYREGTHNLHSDIITINDYFNNIFGGD